MDWGTPAKVSELWRVLNGPWGELMGSKLGSLGETLERPLQHGETLGKALGP